MLRYNRANDKHKKTPKRKMVYAKGTTGNYWLKNSEGWYMTRHKTLVGLKRDYGTGYTYVKSPTKP